MRDDQPNILFIQVDQLVASVLSAYGGTICRTPNLDRLAGEGIVFDTAYCNFPLCAPSRFSMASGQLASRIGAYDNAAEFPSSIPTYAHYLRALGYQTCLSGKMHFVGPDQLHGFEKRLTSDIYPSDFEWTADWSATGFGGATGVSVFLGSGICNRSVQIDYDEETTNKAVQELYDIARSGDQRPFFLQVSYTHPHDPYMCTRHYWDLYEEGEVPAPAVGFIADEDNDPHSLRVQRQHGLTGNALPPDAIYRARHAYFGAVSYVDDLVGRLLHALDGSGQADNTVIVFCSDHGEMLGERGLWLKKTFFEPALRVPLIIHAPNRYKQGRVREFASLVDLLPTFAGIASGGKWQGPVEPLDGTDLTSLLAAPAATPERPVYAELLCEGILAPIFMIRRGRYKLMTSTGDPDLLYDVEADPNETVNLAGDPGHAEPLKALKAEAQAKWDSEALARDIVLSQQRRLLIKQAHAQGKKPDWDFIPTAGADEKWYRGDGNYNDWAMKVL
jgi:choline-sulfatase